MRLSNSGNKKQLIKELKGLGYKCVKDMSGLGTRMNCETNKMVYIKADFSGLRVIEKEEEVVVVAVAEAIAAGRVGVEPNRRRIFQIGESSISVGIVLDCRSHFHEVVYEN